MKIITVLLILLCSFNSRAQDIQKIEQDLLTSYKRIDYWFLKMRDADPATMMMSGTFYEDSLKAANRNFSKKLLFYTSHQPATLSAEFKELQQASMTILTSPDKKLRIYRWGTYMGLRERGTEELFQYKGDKIHVRNTYEEGTTESDSTDGGIDIGLRYFKINMLAIGNRTIYLIPCSYCISGKDCHEDIQLYEIKNDSLTQNVPLIKTKENLTSNLGFDFDFSTVKDYSNGLIWYDEKQKTITFPVVLEDGKVTDKRIVYQFNGEYFVKQQK